MNNKKVIQILIIVVATAFLGELKIIPFGSSFRFGLGSAVFFFLLLFYKDVPFRMTGIVTGIGTTFFRIGLDYLTVDSFVFFEAFQSHSPIIGYYFTFALLLQVIKEKKLYDSPVWLGLSGAFVDGVSNVVELSVIELMTQDNIFNSLNFRYILTVAVLRSFLVVGLFNMIQVNKLKAVYDEQRSRFEQVQTILAELYIEVFYLKKTLSELEEVTSKGHKLYRELKGVPVPNELSKLALSVTQEVHEVKKDNQRILAGLEKVIKQEKVVMPSSLAEIIDISIKSNQNYVEFLKKDITISTTVLTDKKILPVFPLLIIMNNLVANAIEAVLEKGHISINSKEERNQIIIEVIDNGIGIAKAEQEVIFEPGFTTKFDGAGRASTGIGLSHVKSMVEELEGSISVLSEKGVTTFFIRLPVSRMGV